MAQITRNQPWITTTEYVDTETGEVLKKREAERHYIKLGKTIRNENDGTINIKRITWECGKDRQTELFR